MSLRDASRRGERHHHDLETQPIDQARELVTDIAPRRHDERFGDGAGRDQKTVLGFEHGTAGVGFRLIEDDRHQRRRIDGNHPGKPSSP